MEREVQGFTAKVKVKVNLLGLCAWLSCPAIRTAQTETRWLTWFPAWSLVFYCQQYTSLSCRTTQMRCSDEIQELEQPHTFPWEILLPPLSEQTRCEREWVSHQYYTSAWEQRVPGRNKLISPGKYYIFKMTFKDHMTPLYFRYNSSAIIFMLWIWTFHQQS